MKLTLSLTLIFLLLISSSCTMHSQWGEKINWVNIDFNNLPDESDYPDASAVVLFDEGIMDVLSRASKGETSYERHRIVKVLKSSGHYLANISIPYGSKSRIVEIKARTISEDGSISVVKPENIFDINLYPNFVFFSDQRAKIFTFPAVSNGSILEYRYKIHISGSMVTPSWSFQEHIPVLRSRFKLVVPSTWDLRYKLYGRALEPDILSSPHTNQSTYVWDAQTIPAIVDEFAMPPMREIGIWLFIAPPGIEEWDDVSSWYSELSSPKEKPSQDIEKKVQELTSGMDNDQDKLKSIYDWTRDNVRYISVSIGIGGFQPHAASEIFHNRYGDCKDMSTLLCTMTKLAGIKSHQVLVSTRQNGMPDTSIASPHHFNHVIAFAPEIGDSGVWMDATGKAVPFDVLPWYDQGLPVLVVKEDGKSEFRMTPKSPPLSNGYRINWNVTLGRKGQANIQGETAYHGEHANDLREHLRYLNVDKKLRWIRQYISDTSPGSVLDTFFISGEELNNDSLKIHYNFHSESFAMRHKDYMIIRPSEIFRMELPRVILSEKRANPLRFRYGLKCSSILTIKFPANWETNFSTRTDSIGCEFGNAYWRWEPYNSYLVCESGFLLTGDEVNDKKYDNFRGFLKKVYSEDTKEISLKRKDPVFP